MMISVENHHPGLINTGTKADGSKSFKLVDVAAANGIVHQKAHDAMSDVKTTLELCKIIENKAPDRWSDFMQFSRKPAADEFIKSEEPFCILSPYTNPQSSISLFLGVSRIKPWVSYSVSLEFDHQMLSQMSSSELQSRLNSNNRIVREVKSNAFPLVSDIYNAEELLGYSTNQVERFENSAQFILQSSKYKQRLIEAADKLLPEFPDSPYPEKQLYGNGFLDDRQRTQLWTFHEHLWENRVDVLKHISDSRYKRLGAQLIYAAAPQFLSCKARSNVEKLMATACLNGDSTRKKPPLADLKELAQSLATLSQENRSILTGYLEYLESVESYCLSCLN